MSVFYLKDKIDDKQLSDEGGTFNTVDAELLEALTTLGYSVVEAQNAIPDIDVDSSVDLEDRIVLALRYLSKCCWESYIMLENRQIAFVGAGAMGGAMISGVLARNVIEPGQIIAADPRRDVCDALHRKYGVSVTTNNIVACKDADVIVLSVKPQVLNEVCEGLSGSIGSD